MILERAYFGEVQRKHTFLCNLLFRIFALSFLAFALASITIALVKESVAVYARYNKQECQTRGETQNRRTLYHKRRKREE